jgi:uncharacterized protein YbaP (TraB family)
MKRLFIIFAILLITGCANPSPVTDNWADMPENHAPALWQISKGDEHAYLFGSIHALPEDINWFGPDVAKAFNEADILVMEIDARKEGAAIGKALQKLGKTKGLGPVKRRIDPQLHDELRILQKASGLDDGAFSSREDWAAALALAGVATKDLGVSGKYGVETILGKKARAANKPVIALETAAEQFGYFDRLPDAAQKAMLEAVISGADSAKQSYRDLLASWLNGDVASLAIDAQSGLLGTDAVRQSLLVARNRNWESKIITIMQSGKIPFIAVGAAHLAGDDSVQQMLSDSGYTISRVQ